MEDLNIKIATNSEEAFWTKVKDKCTNDITEMRRNIIINEAIIECAKNKINEEKENGK